MCEQTGYRVKRVEKKKNRKRTKTPRPKPGKSFEREDLENAFEITIKAHRIRFVKMDFDDFGSMQMTLQHLDIHLDVLCDSVTYFDSDLVCYLFQNWS